MIWWEYTRWCHHTWLAIKWKFTSLGKSEAGCSSKPFWITKGYGTWQCSLHFSSSLAVSVPKSLGLSKKHSYFLFEPATMNMLHTSQSCYCIQKITLLRVIPTMAFNSSHLTFCLANLLAFYLPFCLRFYLAYLLAFYL